MSQDDRPAGKPVYRPPAPALAAPQHPAIREVFDLVGAKWPVAILASLNRRAVRFGVLKRELQGISQRMLTRTLKQLERDGLVIRTVHETTPPHVTYELSLLGASLLRPVSDLADWGIKNHNQTLAARFVYDSHADRSEAEHEDQLDDGVGVEDLDEGLGAVPRLRTDQTGWARPGERLGSRFGT